MYRLYHDFLFTGGPPPVDEAGRIRLDDREMHPDVQDAVRALWEKAGTDNLKDIADLEGLKQEFLRHHGFNMPGIDYDLDIPPDRI
jgi:enoyl-[acyl-carrier protein] reductase/trans-2-enoyl-CoA reductase (NAD+)